ncbi:unnamed protein product, partial [Polarella glacialis]
SGPPERTLSALRRGGRLRLPAATMYGTSNNSYGPGSKLQPSVSGGLAAPSYSGMYGTRNSSKLTSQEKEIIDVAFESFKDETGFITTE